MPGYSELIKVSQQIPDDPQRFPTEVFALMEEQGLLKFSLPRNEKGGQPAIFETLFKIGEVNLSVGRIYEGHVNALKLIEDFGTEEQQNFYFNEAENGKLFSVWNTEMPSEAVKGIIDNGLLHLRGAKTFCSGGLEIDYGIITAEIEGHKQMVLIPLKSVEELKEDWSLWNPMGMRNSVSCRIDYTGLNLPLKNLLGGSDDYEKEPWFSGGAMRFAAVQLGGASAVLKATRDHLIQQSRSNDPYQQHRIGSMAIQLQTGKLWMEKAQSIYNHSQKHSPEEIMNFANMMRTVVLDISEDILSMAERSVGVQGFMENHPLEQLYRDLKVYLKQPAPDITLQNVGKYTIQYHCS